MLIEQYDIERTQSRDIIIIGHWMKITWNTIALNEIVFFVDRTETHSDFKIT